MLAADLTFFTAGQNSLLRALTLRHGLGSGQLALPAILLAVLLGYCAYTDLFCGRIIRNNVVGAVALAAAASAPVIFADVRSHFMWAGVMLVLAFLLYMTRAVAEGDLKLYAALAFVFAQGLAVLALVSFAIIVAYGYPYMISRHARAVREKRKAGLTKMPAAPGIALAYPLTMLLAGVSARDCLLLTAVEVAAVAVSLAFSAMSARAAAHPVPEAADGDRDVAAVQPSN